MLALADLADMTETEVKNHLVVGYSGVAGEGYSGGETSPEHKAAVAAWLDGAEVLIAYESVGDYGCDSSSWFLLRKDGNLYETAGSHCSCYGFEGQWNPSETSIAYLTSEKFCLPCGGYDDNEDDNKKRVVAFLRDLSAWITPT